MTQNSHQRVKELFGVAIRLRGVDRERFLENIPDLDIRKDVLSLLNAREEAGSFLEDITAVEAVERSFRKLSSGNYIGTYIDRYHIEREIGRGGMGVVFLATRKEFRQTVALKLVKRGMDTDAIVDRFCREREILGALDHPNIAKMLDGGTTNDGLPYFVMEYVDGVPIDILSRSRSLPDILQIFRHVCAAVSFAHQHLVIHRDLKPTNILVDAGGVPKLLDFGVAKILDDTAEQTRLEDRILTPEYASPEQLAGRIVGTTSDIFSLGRLLKKLVESSPDASRIESDLRAIIKTATADDPEERYTSVDRLSDDIRRHLNHMPVNARGRSVSYTARKFVRRNRAKVLLGSIAIASLLIGSTAAILNAREAERERSLAEQRLLNLRQLSDSFVTDVHAAIRDLPGSLPARRLLLERAIGQLDALSAENTNNPDLRRDIGKAYFKFASLPDLPLKEKERILGTVLGIYDSLLVSNPKDRGLLHDQAEVQMELSDIRKVEGLVGESLPYALSAVETLKRARDLGDADKDIVVDLRDAYAGLGSYQMITGKLEEARKNGEIVLGLSEEIKKRDGDDDLGERCIARSHLQMGTLEMRSGSLSRSKEELDVAMSMLRSLQDKNPSDTNLMYYRWATHRWLVDLMHKRHDPAEALKNAQAAYEIMDSLIQASPSDTGYNRNFAFSSQLMGDALVDEKRAADAIRYFEASIVTSTKVSEKDPDYTESRIDIARARSHLGRALVLVGRKKKGLELLRKAFEDLQSFYQRDTSNSFVHDDLDEVNSWLSDEAPLDNKLYW